MTTREDYAPNMTTRWHRNGDHWTRVTSVNGENVTQRIIEMSTGFGVEHGQTSRLVKTPSGWEMQHPIAKVFRTRPDAEGWADGALAAQEDWPT